MEFSRSIRTSATASGVAAVEIFAGPNRGFNLIELAISIVNATASTFALGRPAAVGITPTTPVQLLSPLNDFSLTDAKLAVAWGTGPTIPAAFYRQVTLPATAGYERVWKFTQPLAVRATKSLILWTLSTVSIADVTFVIDED